VSFSDCDLVNAHENPYFREAISLLLASVFPELRIFEAANRTLLLRRVSEIRPDMLILGYHTASENYFELITAVRDAGCPAPVILVCDFVEDVLVTRALEFGVRAFIYEGALYTDIKEAVSAVLEGDTFFSKF